MFQMELCESLGGMTLSEMNARMGASELLLWKAKTEVDNFVHHREQMMKLDRKQALEHARADHRATIEKHHRRRQKTS